MRYASIVSGVICQFRMHFRPMKTKEPSLRAQGQNSYLALKDVKQYHRASDQIDAQTIVHESCPDSKGTRSTWCFFYLPPCMCIMCIMCITCPKATPCGFPWHLAIPTVATAMSVEVQSLAINALTKRIQEEAKVLPVAWCNVEL